MPTDGTASARTPSVESDDALEITTAAAQWSYAATWDLTQLSLAAKSAIIRVRLQVDDGGIGISVYRKQDASTLYGEVHARQSKRPDEVDLYLIDGTRAEALLVRNLSPGGISKVRIFSIKVFQPQGTPALSFGIDVPISECKSAGGQIIRPHELAAAAEGHTDNRENVITLGVPINEGVAVEGQLAPHDDVADINTASSQWAYAAMWDLTYLNLETKPTTIRLRLQVDEGVVGISANPIGNVSELMGEVQISKSTEPVEALVQLGNGADIEHVIVRNACSGGKSKARIFSIDVIQPLSSRGGAFSRSVALDQARAADGEITCSDNMLVVTTAHAQWRYAATWNLRAFNLRPRPADIRIRLCLESGSVGISVNKTGDISALLGEINVRSAGRDIDVDITLDNGALAENLVIRNSSAAGPSRVHVYAISIAESP